MKTITFIALIVVFNLIFIPHLYAKISIFNASFGTTVSSAVQSITNITSRVKAAFPDTEVKVVFTSNIIRSTREKNLKTLKIG